MVIISNSNEDINWEEARKHKDEVLRLLRKYGSQRELARQLGESRTTVQHWVYKHDISADDYMDKKEEREAPEKERKPSVEKINMEDGMYYIIHSSSGDYKIEKELIEEFLELYSQAGMTKNQVATELEISRDKVNAIWSAFDITHDSVPYLNEDIKKSDVDDLVEDTIERDKKLYWKLLDKKKENKAYKELKKYYKEEWKLNKVLDGLKDSIDRIGYQEPEREIEVEKRTGDILIVNLSDLHIGKKVLGEYLIDKTIEGYNEDIFEKRIKKYKKEIVKLIQLYKPDKVIILNAGDGLDSPDADVYEGQKLNQDVYGEEQFMNYVFCIRDIILTIYDFVADIDYYGVEGNHSGNDIINWDILSGKVIKEMLKEYSDINFYVEKAKYKVVEVYNTNIVLTHGNELRGGKYTREVDLLNIVRMGELNNKQTYVVSAHKHSYESKEGVKYRFIQLPSVVGGDELSSDMMNVSARPAQLVFKVTNKGIESEHFVYFD